MSDSSKILNLYLDSVIAPAALNEEFYEEINNLSPFGSGNNEPKFVLENLKVFEYIWLVYGFVVYYSKLI